VHKFIFGLLLLALFSSCASVPDRSVATEDEGKKESESNTKHRQSRFIRERP
jgi:hypothetical protein